MEEEKATPPGAANRLLWVLVVVAIAALWWYFRGRADGKIAEQAALSADAIAAEMPDEIIVDLVDDVTPDQIAAIEQAEGIKLTLDSDQAKSAELFIAKVEPARRDAILADLVQNPLVEIAEPDAKIELSAIEQEEIRSPLPATWEGFPNDPQYKFQWHMDQIGMPAAWKLADGNGVTVAVLDTGVGFENYANMHVLPDLDGVTFVDPYNFVSNNAHAGDDHGHGSHVTGTIAQMTNNGIGVSGIARNVKIMPLKVLSAGGSGSTAGIADAIRFAADKGAKVINMSLGGPFPSGELKKAVKYAHDKGVIVICAAGNDGRGKVGYPAGYPGAVAISATQYDENTTFYSNYGKDIDIAAPGGNMREDQNGDGMMDGVLQNTIVIGNPKEDGYFGFMGTSMAAPHAAGVAALVVGEGVTDPDMVQKILQDTARKPAKQKYTTDKYGAGIIDAPAAILKARAETGGFQLGLGVLMAGAIAASARRKRGLGVKLGPSYLVGVLFGASGLFFLPYIAPSFSSLPGIHALTHGLPSWDLSLLGVNGHGNALFFSALIPLALLAVGYSAPRLRAPLAGVAIGVAAHLAFFAVVPMMSIHYVPHAFGLGTIWLAVNAVLSLGLARLALRR